MTPAPELYKGQSCCGQQEQILLGQKGQSRVAFPNNIDCILVNSNYLFFKEYVMGLLFNRFSLEFPVDPFFQLFTHNYLIENTSSQERNLLLESIIQQKVYIVDETYANSLPKKSIAKFTGDRMIKFMPFTDK